MGWLQSVAECCRVLQSVAETCSELQWVAVCYSVLQCVAMCCSVLQWLMGWWQLWARHLHVNESCKHLNQSCHIWIRRDTYWYVTPRMDESCHTCLTMTRHAQVTGCCGVVCCSVLQCVAVCCSVLQCIAMCCSVLPCVAVCCRALQCVAVYWSVLHCVAVCCSDSWAGGRYAQVISNMNTPRSCTWTSHVTLESLMNESRTWTSHVPHESRINESRIQVSHVNTRVTSRMSHAWVMHECVTYLTEPHHA